MYGSQIKKKGQSCHWMPFVPFLIGVLHILQTVALTTVYIQPKFVCIIIFEKGRRLKRKRRVAKKPFVSIGEKVYTDAIGHSLVEHVYSMRIYIYIYTFTMKPNPSSSLVARRLPSGTAKETVEMTPTRRHNLTFGRHCLTRRDGKSRSSILLLFVDKVPDYVQADKKPFDLSKTKSVVQQKTTLERSRMSVFSKAAQPLFSKYKC